MGNYVGIALLIILVAIPLYIISLRNNLVRKKNQIDNAFGSIDAMLKKRYDLIPNLVSAVKQYMEHEKSILSEITELRTRALKGDIGDEEKLEIDSHMTRAIGRLMVAVENYPQLKANENFLQLQAALNEVEEQIAAARRFYNAAVTAYNNAIEVFPSNLIAQRMNYRRKKVFEVEERERKNVDVGAMFEQKGKG